LFLGVDIGGTTIHISVFRSLADTKPVAGENIPVTGVYAVDYELLMTACRLQTGLNYEEHGALEGIGLAIAGVLDKKRTTLMKAGNTRQWVDQPFVRKLEEQFGCPVAFGNDAEAAAMAEAMYGNPDGEDFWFVIWGTGVGGALVRYVGGKPVAFPGEVGHQRVSESDERMPKIYFGGGIAAKQPRFVPELEDLLRMELRIVDSPDMELSVFGESAGTVGALALMKNALA
jgi:predicted NBD/HSP70 family sugar kinase